MGLGNVQDTSLEKQFRDAIEYIELNEYPNVTICGIDICTLKGCTDENMMKQIVDMVDAIKDYKSYSPHKEEKSFVRNRKPVFNKQNQTIYSKNIS